MSAPGPVRAAEDTRSDWETPDKLFRALHLAFGFSIDAAADTENHKLPRYLSGPCSDYDGCECGLCEPWWGETVWLNPPYGRGIERWIYKCIKESKHTTIVALLPANTDTEWFRLVWWGAAEIWFLKGRVQFVGTTSSNPGGSMVAVFRPRPEGLSISGPSVRLWEWKA